MNSWDIRKMIEECDEQIARVDAHMNAMKQEFQRLTEERTHLDGRRTAYMVVVEDMMAEEANAEDNGDPEHAE